MKIIYMGTPDFAVAPLEALIRAGHEIIAVVTQPDRQKGRGKEVQFSPVKECALRYGIPVLQPLKIRTEEAVAELKSYPADLFVIAAFGQILSEEILTMPKYGCINIHASLLPKYRGAAPIQWAIIDGEEKSGVTIMQMEKGLDTGDMLLKKEVPIESCDTGESLHDKLMAAGAELVCEVIPMIEQGTITPIKQQEELACYAAKLEKSLGELDFSKPAVYLERLIRALNPWPSAYTFYKGKTLKIWEADVISKNCPGKEGEVVQVEKDYFDVATGEGILRIRSLQLEGKKRMNSGDFMRGYEITCGMKLLKE